MTVRGEFRNTAATTMLRTEARLLVRNPGVVLWTTLLPVIGCIVLAAVPATRKPSAGLGGLSFFQAYQPILVLFAITLLAVQSLPDVLTRYREMGVLKRLRTTPVSPAVLLYAQLELILAVSVGCGAVMVVAPAVIGAPLPRNLPAFALAYLLAAWALLGVGMVIASLFHNAKVAAGFGSALFFVLQFLAGLWWQRQQMPGWLRHVSDASPSGAAVQALTDASVGHWPQLVSLAVLAVWGVLLSAVAIRLFSWE